MIICVVGLPGSGKTWYAKNVLKWDYLVDDPTDFFDFPRDVPPEKTVVVCDPALCMSKTRAKSILGVMYPEHEIEWIFFENDLEQCKKNVAYRNDGRKVNITLEHLSKNYVIPEGVVPLPVWRPL